MEAAGECNELTDLVRRAVLQLYSKFSLYLSLSLACHEAQVLNLCRILGESDINPCPLLSETVAGCA